MTGKEIGRYIGNGLDKTKEIVLALFGKTADAFNDYDVNVNVVEHGKGADAEPTGTRNYHHKYRINLGNVALAAIAGLTVLAITLGIASLFNKD
jgi:ABC-type sugar transport system permease subunit